MTLPHLFARAAVATLATGVLAAAVLASPAASDATPAKPAGSSAGSGEFAAGAQWTGEFADPSITRVGRTYWAYATTTGGDNLPVLHSTDLTHWYARNAYPAGANPGWWRGYNDALPHPASWALYDIERNGRSFTRPWAPSVAQVGSGFVDAYSVPVSKTNPNRRCISVATSSSPQGQFTDSSTRPLACSSDPNGSNDPHVFTDGNTAYLVWKNAGVPGKAPTTLWSQQLDGTGTAFAPGSRAHRLMSTAQAWEGNVIEGPAMITYRGHYYLFWAGNDWSSARYAIGYAICRTPTGGCTRQGNGPLLRTGGGIAGPGSPAPVIGPGGALRLGYAAWDAGHVGYGNGGHRRLHVAVLAVTNGAGRLTVTSRG